MSRRLSTGAERKAGQEDHALGRGSVGRRRCDVRCFRLPIISVVPAIAVGFTTLVLPTLVVALW